MTDDSPWQTDAACEATRLPEAPAWLDGHEPGRPVRFVVLDAFGKIMDELDPDGMHNARWTVTTYKAFGRTLRRAHDGGTRGLVPLLVALYAGPLPRPRRI